MATLGVVEEIHRYPVKSMLGESVRTAEFTGRRSWAVPVGLRRRRVVFPRSSCQQEMSLLQTTRWQAGV